MLLSLERANAKALFFTRLIATLPKSFYFFFNRIARYAQSKETRNLSSKNSQITCKAIFRSCLIAMVAMCMVTIGCQKEEPVKSSTNLKEVRQLLKIPRFG